MVSSLLGTRRLLGGVKNILVHSRPCVSHLSISFVWNVGCLVWGILGHQAVGFVCSGRDVHERDRFHVLQFSFLRSYTRHAQKISRRNGIYTALGTNLRWFNFVSYDQTIERMLLFPITLQSCSVPKFWMCKSNTEFCQSILNDME